MTARARARVGIRWIAAPLTVLALASPAQAQNPGQDGDESSGVATRRGDPSPTLGEGHQNDYTHQDEQVHLAPDSGVVTVLRVNQKNLLNDYVTELIPIRHVFPREIRDAIRTVTGLEGGEAEVVRDETGEEAFVQVICPRFQLEKIRAAVAALDVDWVRAGDDGSVTVTYPSRYRPADTLDAIASNYAGEGATQVDRSLDRVSRRDEPFRARQYLEACAALDQPSPQAHLKFRIYEVDAQDDLTLGVDWIAWKNGPGRSLFELILGGQKSRESYGTSTGHFNPSLGATTLTGDGAVRVGASQLWLSANYVLTSAFLDFLRVRGKARILCEAEVSALNNQTGAYTAVDRFLSFDAGPASPGPLGATPSSFDTAPLNKSSVDGSVPDFAAHNRYLSHRASPTNTLGLTLKVRPVIGTESSEVEVEFLCDDLAGTTPQGKPIVSHRRIATKLRLKDGQPFIFGGFTRTERLRSSNKAPWLGDIPLLGGLFGQEHDAARQKRLVVTAIPRFYRGAPKDVEDAVARDTHAMVHGSTLTSRAAAGSSGFDQWMFDHVSEP